MDQQPPRLIRHRYRDPLDVVWTECAGRVGLRVERTPDVYASTDGAGTLFVGEHASLDPDDSLAQMVFHELCHALVEGEAAWRRPDWGLDNRSDRDVARELACIRLQAFLAARHGLRGFLAPTTEFRREYDALPADPLVHGPDDVVAAARAGAARGEQPPFAPHLRLALRATARVVRVVRTFGAIDPRDGPASLYDSGG